MSERDAKNALVASLIVSSINTVGKINIQNRSNERLAASSALATTRQRIGVANDLIDRFDHSDEVQVNHSIVDAVHFSHNILHVHGHPNAFYCDRCGAWSVGGSLRNLSEVCVGLVVQAHKFQLRLLQCGVIPTPGAKIPAHARKCQPRSNFATL